MLERIHHVRVELDGAQPPDLGQRFRPGPGRLVRARMAERVEDVRERNDPRRERNLVAGEAVRIAGAVPPLVVEGRDLLGRLEDVRPTPGEDRAPDLGMGLDDVELLATQWAGLEQDRIGDADFPDVVQESCLTDQLHRLPVEAELDGDAGSHVRNPVRVGLRVVVAILGGECEPRQRLVVGSRELPRRAFQLERALVHRLLQPLLVLTLTRLELLPLGDVARYGEHLAGLEVRSR